MSEVPTETQWIWQAITLVSGTLTIVLGGIDVSQQILVAIGNKPDRTELTAAIAQVKDDIGIILLKKPL